MRSFRYTLNRGFEILLLLVFCSWVYYNSSNKTTLKTIKHRTLKINQLEDKWIVLHYYAAWCHECRQAMPIINEFHHKHKDRDAIVLGVNVVGGYSRSLQALARATGVEFETLTKAPRKQFGLPEIHSLPTTLITSTDGKFVQILTGSQTMDRLELALAEIKQYRASQTGSEKK